MKFGEVMAQIAQANASAFSLASGQKSPLTRAAKLDKDALIQYTMAGMSDADSSKMVGPEGKQLTAGETPDKPPTYGF